MKSILFVAFCSISVGVFAQLIPIPAPLNAYYHSGNDFSRHHEVVRFFETLQSLYPNQVSLQTYGYTNEGRPLMLVFLASEKNFKNLEAMRMQHLSGDTSEQTPIVWLSYNVHGNESCGTEAAMETAYRLVASDSHLLEQSLVIMDPCLNPDGRDRYVNYFKQYRNKSGQFNAQSAEHNEIWPGGRPNHYLFDLNRDWAWLTQVESQQRLKAFNQWLPHVHVDFHEQSMNEPYYFPPAAEPYHEVVTEWQREFQTHIGKHHAKYFDKNGWLYFSKEVFDLLYPSYGDTYPTFIGAIGMTYEQGGSGRAGLGVITGIGDTLTLKERIKHHVIAGISTLETANDYHQKLIDEFQKYYTLSKESKGQSYVLDGSSPNLASLLDLLDQHQIHYITAGENESIDVKGFDYFRNSENTRKIQKNDIVIHTNQAKGNLVNVLFEQKTKLSDSLTYDITAWSLPYAYGIPCIKSQKLVVLSGQGKLEAPLMNPLQEEPYAYAIPWNNLNSAKILNALLDSGIRVSVTEKEITTAEGVFQRGTLFALKAENKSISLAKTIPNILNKFNEKGTVLLSGWAESGTDLGSSSIKSVQKPRVGVLFTNESSFLSVGEIWHFLDVQLGVEHQLLRDGETDAFALSQLDVLFVPEGYKSEQNENLKQWISQGGTCIVMGSGAANFMESDFGMKVTEETPPIISRDLGNYGNMERSSISESIIGAIYRCAMDTTHPLSFGYQEPYFTLRLAADIYPFQGEIVQKIQDKNAWIAGFAGYKVKYQQQGTVTVGARSIGSGKIVYFFDNPLFRGFWSNGKLQVANAMYFMR
jgi:hypothetical protein